MVVTSAIVTFMVPFAFLWSAKLLEYASLSATRTYIFLLEDSATSEWLPTDLTEKKRKKHACFSSLLPFGDCFWNVLVFFMVHETHPSENDYFHFTTHFVNFVERVVELDVLAFML